jgi:hypothetical protein
MQKKVRDWLAKKSNLQIWKFNLNAIPLLEEGFNTQDLCHFCLQDQTNYS